MCLDKNKLFYENFRGIFTMPASRKKTQENVVCSRGGAFQYDIFSQPQTLQDFGSTLFYSKYVLIITESAICLR